MCNACSNTVTIIFYQAVLYYFQYLVKLILKLTNAYFKFRTLLILTKAKLMCTYTCTCYTLSTFHSLILLTLHKFPNSNMRKEPKKIVPRKP